MFSAVAEGRSPERHGAKRSTILRPLTPARNYATIADRKSKFGSVFLIEKFTKTKTYTEKYFLFLIHKIRLIHKMRF